MNTPVAIKFVIIIISAAFLTRELYILYEHDWNLIGLYTKDAVYTGITLFWFACILIVIREIIKRKKYIITIINLLFIISVLSFAIELVGFERTLIEITFRTVEPFLWLIAFIINKNNSEWYIE